jgi:signal transduction histidine kinase
MFLYFFLQSILESRVHLLQGYKISFKKPCGNIYSSFESLKVDMTKEPNKFPKDLLELVELNITNSNYILSVFDDILLCQDIENNTLVLEQSPEDALEIVQKVASNIQSRAKEDGVRLNILGGLIAEQDFKDLKINIDRKKMKLALESVINNAIEVSPKETSASEVMVSLRKVYSGGAVQPRFRDNNLLTAVKIEIWHNRSNENTYKVFFT